MEQRRVALIGSSGGGTATLGHTDPSKFVRLIADHLRCVGDDDASSSSSSSTPVVTLDTVLFVSLDDGAGFDSVTGDEDATLLFIRDGGSERTTHRDALDRINEMVRGFEERTARGFEEGTLHGLICVSCEPSLFERTLRAAAKRGVPVTGTGGSSLAQLASPRYRVRLIGNAGGSVGTTPETKAISFASAFARDWDLPYEPWNLRGGPSTTKRRDDSPSWKSVLNSCLPGFWSAVLLKRLLLTTFVGRFLAEDDRRRLVATIESHALPTFCAVVMAASRRTSESALMSAVLASSACYRSVPGGLISGWLVSVLEERFLYWSLLRWKFPATFTNLITGGLVGVSTAVLMTPLCPYLRLATEGFRSVSISCLWGSKGNAAHDYVPFIASSCLGLLFCYGSKIGWYHSIFLPMILIEMELGDASMLGALDLLTLVLVCSGICFGIIVTGNEEERRLATRGMTINLFYGDFIEACYPHMDRYQMVNLSGYLASSVSAAILTSKCKSSAYLPLPVAIWLAEDRKTFLAACIVAFSIPFIATVLNYVVYVRKKKPD